jgi:hypothetical protein
MNKNTRLFWLVLAGVLLACLIVLGIAGLMAGGKLDAQKTQTQQAIYQEWDLTLTPAR